MKRRRLPRDQRPQRRVGVDEVALDAACASFAIRFASESKPQLAMQRKRLPLTSPTSISRVAPGREHATAASALVGDPEHAGEVVAAPAGDHAHRRAGARRARRRPGRSARRRSSRPGSRRPPPPRRASLAAVLEALGVSTRAVLEPARLAAPRSTSRQQLARARPPPAEGLTSSRYRLAGRHRDMSRFSLPAAGLRPTKQVPGARSRRSRPARSRGGESRARAPPSGV